MSVTQEDTRIPRVCRITQRQTSPAWQGVMNQPLRCKYDPWLLCLQCKTASKSGSETSISSLKINKWAEEASLLCKGRTRSVLSPKMSQYTRTPKEVQAERTFHIWMIKTFNQVIHFHHHGTFRALSIIESTHRLRKRIQECSIPNTGSQNFLILPSYHSWPEETGLTEKVR